MCLAPLHLAICLHTQLLWVKTPPVPPVPTYGPACNTTSKCLNPPRFDNDVVLYNNAADAVVAAAVAKGAQIGTADLYSFVLGKCGGVGYAHCDGFQLPMNVHYTAAGWTALATEMHRILRTTHAATPTTPSDPVSAPLLVPAGPCDGCVPVFYGGLGGNGSKCFRIPTIIQTHTGALLAFAENRMSDCGDNGKQHALVMRRSEDLGKTWGAMATVMEGTVPCPGCPAAISNPNPVEVEMKDVSLSK